MSVQLQVSIFIKKFPVNIYLFKVTIEALEKGVQYVQINSKSRSGVYIVNFELFYTFL